MGAIKEFNETNSAVFVKPQNLPEFGAIHIEYASIEDWCDKIVFFFTKKGGDKKYKSIANFQIEKTCEFLASRSEVPISRFEIDEYGHFIAKESKSGKKYNWFVLE